LPREWDYVVDNNLKRLETESLASLTGLATRVRTPGCWRGGAAASCIRSSACPRAWNTGPGPLSGWRSPRPAGRLPAGARGREWASASSPAGSAAAKIYPGARTWIAIIHALRARFPDASIYLTGSRTAAYSEPEIGAMLGCDPAVVDCFGRGSDRGHAALGTAAADPDGTYVLRVRLLAGLSGRPGARCATSSAPR
jgi:hypothetical protein